MIESIAAIITALFVIIVNTILLKKISDKLIAATVLCSIAFIYVGFALTENVTRNIILEIVVALIFYFIAITGYSKNSYLIALGIILHGFWDISHHSISIVSTDIPDYYPLFCLIVDILLGIYFFLLFKMKGIESKKRA